MSTPDPNNPTNPTSPANPYPAPATESEPDIKMRPWSAQEMTALRAAATERLLPSKKQMTARVNAVHGTDKSLFREESAVLMKFYEMRYMSDVLITHSDSEWSD